MPDGQRFPVQRLCRCLLWLLAFWGLPAPGADTVALILSERAGAYAEVAAELRNALRSGPGIIEATPDEAATLARRRPRLCVAVGTQACRAAAAANSSAPLVCVLVPRFAYERISTAVRGRAKTALLLDQPVSRQMALIKFAVPERRKVAALLGAESGSLAGALASGAAEQGLRFVSRRVDNADELHAALQVVLDDADVLLAVPDSGVYNSRTVQNILRTAFQSNVPLVAFSPAYVKAGALVAVYATPAQIGRQAAAWVDRFLEGHPLPPVQHSRDFEVSVNRNVARALGVTIDDGAALAERLHRMEGAR